MIAAENAFMVFHHSAPFVHLMIHADGRIIDRNGIKVGSVKPENRFNLKLHWLEQGFTIREGMTLNAKD